MKFLDNLMEYWKDKRAAEQCGLTVKDICIHRAEFVITHPEGLSRCIKCGDYYSHDPIETQCPQGDEFK